MADRARERAVPPARARRRPERAPRPGRARAAAGRAAGPRGQASRPSVRRDEAARPAGARPRARGARPPHGRALRRPRRADPAHPAGGADADRRPDAADDPVHPPRYPRGDLPGQPHRRHDGRPRVDDQEDRRGRAAAAARPGQRGVRRAVRGDPPDPLGGSPARAAGRGQPAVTPTREGRSIRFLGYAASVAVVLLLWQYLSSRAVIPLLFPSPLSTLRVGLGLAAKGQLQADLWASLARILAGFALGSALGVTGGILMGSFRPARLFFEPYLQFLRFLPALAWIPAVMLWLGTGERAKIALLAYTTVFIVALNTMVGVTRVPRNQVRAARSFGATRWKIFVLVTIPATVSHMLTGMRLAMGNCFMTVVAAELVASDSGL